MMKHYKFKFKYEGPTGVTSEGDGEGTGKDMADAVKQAKECVVKTFNCSPECVSITSVVETGPASTEKGTA